MVSRLPRSTVRQRGEDVQSRRDRLRREEHVSAGVGDRVRDLGLLLLVDGIEDLGRDVDLAAGLVKAGLGVTETTCTNAVRAVNDPVVGAADLRRPLGGRLDREGEGGELSRRSRGERDGEVGRTRR